MPLAVGSNAATEGRQGAVSGPAELLVDPGLQVPAAEVAFRAELTSLARSEQRQVGIPDPGAPDAWQGPAPIVTGNDRLSPHNSCLPSTSAMASGPDQRENSPIPTTPPASGLRARQSRIDDLMPVNVSLHQRGGAVGVVARIADLSAESDQDVLMGLGDVVGNGGKVLSGLRVNGRDISPIVRSGRR